MKTHLSQQALEEKKTQTKPTNELKKTPTKPKKQILEAQSCERQLKDSWQSKPAFCREAGERNQHPSLEEKEHFTTTPQHSLMHIIIQ